MKIKSLALALMLAMSAPAVWAENQTFDIPLTGPSPDGTYTTGFEVQHVVAGAFTDTFTFTPTNLNGFIKGSLVTTGTLPSTDINFISGSINGIAFEFSPNGVNEFGFTAKEFASGPIILQLFGIAGPSLTPGDAMTGSYSGTFNLAISAVPEPVAFMLGFVGMFLVALSSRTPRIRFVR